MQGGEQARVFSESQGHPLIHALASKSQQSMADGPWSMDWSMTGRASTDDSFPGCHARPRGWFGRASPACQLDSETASELRDGRSGDHGGQSQSWDEHPTRGSISLVEAFLSSHGGHEVQRRRAGGRAWRGALVRSIDESFIAELGSV